MKTISAEQLKKRMQENPDLMVINTLDRQDFQTRHIPQTTNVPRTETNFASRVEQIAGGKERDIVVYCASKSCDSSEKAARLLEEAGFSNVYDFQAGTKGWLSAGYPLSSAPAPAGV